MFHCLEFIIEGNAAEGACGGGEGPNFNNFNFNWLYLFRSTNVIRQVLLFSSYFTTFPGLVAPAMWFWLRRLCGGWVGENENKANSAQLELELGLSLAIKYSNPIDKVSS